MVSCWVWAGVEAELDVAGTLDLGTGGLILPSMQEEHFPSAQLSISNWPYPMILLPEQSLPTITASTPNNMVTTSTAINGPIEVCVEWALKDCGVIDTGGGCWSDGIDIFGQLALKCFL